MAGFGDSYNRDGRLIGGLLIRVRACGPGREDPAGNRRALKLQEPGSGRSSGRRYTLQRSAVRGWCLAQG